jgi:hypothetical protein
MPPTLVHVALGVLVAAALLPHDRRALLVVAAAAALPDLDALLAAAVPGGHLHGAALHTLFLPLVVAVVLSWETRREGSWLRARGAVRLAWVALLAFVLAGIVPDLFNVDAAAPLWPLHDRFYSFVGRFELSNQRGVFQTFVGTGYDLGLRGSNYCQPSVLTPACPADGSALVESGWQLLLVLAAVVVVAVAELREVRD